jgi:hypothetical protein
MQPEVSRAGLSYFLSVLKDGRQVGHTSRDYPASIFAQHALFRQTGK